MINATYQPLWHKYRPALLQTMIAAADGPSAYKFFKHEFEALNPRERGGYTFTLQVFQSKATNNIRNCIIAKDLLNVLEASRKAAALTEEATYEFVLDRQFVLHVTKLEHEMEVTEDADDEPGEEQAETASE
jgi:hypothetical protein